jgi:hypothetical protein
MRICNLRTASGTLPVMYYPATKRKRVKRARKKQVLQPESEISESGN